MSDQVAASYCSVICFGVRDSSSLLLSILSISDNSSHLLHHFFLVGDELKCSLEGGVYKRADLLIYKLGCRFTVGLLSYYVTLLREVEGHLTHRLIHSKLYNLKYEDRPILLIKRQTALYVPLVTTSFSD